MDNVILCCGRYAKNPYFLKEECQNLYSIEELCYYLYNNAYLHDDTFICDNLIQWIHDELGLGELAERLLLIKGKPDALVKTVFTLMEDIGYYGQDEWNEMLGILKEQNHLTVQEKRKARADNFLHNNKYTMAADEYEILLKETDESQIKLRAKIYHNMGICAVNQFLFERASKYFKEAYDTYANTESYVQYLTSLKMNMTPQEYLNFLSKHPESYEDSLEVERRIESLKQQWKIQPVLKHFKELSDLKDKGNPYYTGIDEMTENVKEEYRLTLYKTT